MTYLIISVIVAFLCGAAAVAYPMVAYVQLSCWELGRLGHVRDTISRECCGCSRVERILELIDKENENE